MSWRAKRPAWTMIKQDEELDKLEEDIRRLKNKYDQFFAGIVKLPPSFERHQLEAYIHELNKLKMRDNTRRFRFSTLMSRFNQYREMWGRKMREREEGPLDYRRRKAALEAPLESPKHHEPPPRESRPVTSAGDDAYVKVTPGSNGESLQRLHEAIENEHRKLGKSSGLTMEQLSAMIRKQTDLVRAKYNVRSVAFRVETVDGKVKLKAKPLQD